MQSLAFSVYDTEITAFVVAAVLLQLAALQAALEAILKSRTAPGAIAWSLSLTFLPLFMLPLWWIFGRRKFKGYARAKRRGTSRISQVARDLHAQLLQYDAGHGQTLGAIRNLTQMPTTEGNSVEVLIDGAAFQAALERIIREAEHYLLIEFYILRDDNIGLALRDLLIEKAQQGVEIHVLYDEIGSFQLSRGYIDQLRNHGIDIRSFHTTKGRRNRFQINFRNHRKTVIADGRVGMTGGSNIGDEYLGHDAWLTPWRDTNIVVRGPAVQCLQLAFLEDWFWACDRVPRLNWVPETTGAVCATIVPSGPADSVETCLLYFLQLISMAKRRLWIVSPYFVPDSAILSALQLAALRGVDVRIMLPARADNRLVQLASYALMDEIQRVGVRLYRFQDGFLHQKVWLVDDETVSIGTANLDNRSFRLNFELSVLVTDRDTAVQVERMLENDFRHCREIEPGIFQRHGWPFRLSVRLAYLLAPIL